MARRFNEPNWVQTVTVYRPGTADVLEDFTIEQSWDGTLRGFRRLRHQVVEHVEGLRDITGLEYMLWGPVFRPDKDIPAADRRHITIG